MKLLQHMKCSEDGITPCYGVTLSQLHEHAHQTPVSHRTHLLTNFAGRQEDCHAHKDMGGLAGPCKRGTCNQHTFAVM